MEDNIKHVLWTEKYKPTTLSEYLFHDDDHRESIGEMVADGTIPHLLFSGVQGTGKTTLAKVIINELDIEEMDVLILNASDENSVDTMREKIKSFISTVAFGKFKVVLLDEADYISHNGQSILRNMMDSEGVRFILTCNYENKIIPPLKSRLQHFRFSKGDKNVITEHVAKILISEKIKWDIELVDAYVAIGYPDIRKVINLLQQHSNNGVLRKVNVSGNEGDYKFELLELLSQGNWERIRTLCCENVSNNEWEDLYKFLYENLKKSKKFNDVSKWESGIVTIAEYLYKHSFCADPEINAAAMFIQLDHI